MLVSAHTAVTPQGPFMPSPPVALFLGAELVGDSCPIPLLSGVSVSGSGRIGRGHRPNISGGQSDPVELQSMELPRQWEHMRHRGVCLWGGVCRSVFVQRSTPGTCALTYNLLTGSDQR